MVRSCLVLSLLVVFVSNVLADTPVGPMNYQGRLLDNAGIPVTGSYNFVVRVYDAVSGGILKYQENHNAVAVDDGVYAFLVGTQTKTGGDSTWSVELWNCCANLFMEIVVNGEALSPRHRLAAAPYAFQANLALTTNNALNAQALGGKSAGSVLGDICQSGKGKWLEIAQKCLGVGASFPGPAMVNLGTLTASTDLSHLDLTNADISGINFGSANFTGTLFKGTTVNGAGVGNANMTSTEWNAVTVIGTKTFSNNFTGAKISNLDMSGWNLAGAILTDSSIAELIACPVSLPASPAQYRCRNTGGIDLPTRYMILGPNMNLSENSLVKGRLDADFNPYGTLFNNANSDLVPIPVNLAGVSFAGNNFNTGFLSVNLSGASFKRAIIRDANFENCNLSSTDFSQASIYKTGFRGIQGGGYASFSSAEMNSVLFGAGDMDSSFSFGGAVLDGVDFRQWGTGNMTLDFSQATLKNVNINAKVTSLYAISTDVYGGLYLGPEVDNVSFENMNFVNGNLSGNYKNIHDESSYYTNVSFNGADLTGSTGWENNLYSSVNWFGATCPDGYQVSTQGGTCVGHFEP